MRIKILLLTVLSFFTLIVSAQNMDKLMSQFIEVDSVSFREITRDYIFKHFSGKAKIDQQDIENIKKIQSIQIFDFSPCSEKDKQRVKSRWERIKWKNYVTLAENLVDEGIDYIYAKVEANDVLSDVIISCVEKNTTLRIIRIKGSLTRKLIDKIIHSR